MRHLVHFFLMRLGELTGNCVLFVNNAANFCIDLFHRALGDMLGLSHGAAEEHFVLVFAVDHRTHHIAHTVAANHLAGHLSGSFKVVATKARKGRNPRTGEVLKIAASKKVRFNVSTKLHTDVNTKKAAKSAAKKAK